MNQNTIEHGLEQEGRAGVWRDRWFNRIPLLHNLGKKRPSKQWYIFRWLSTYGPGVFFCGNIACALAGMGFGRALFLISIQYWLMFCGTMQIAAAAYMSVDKTIFLQRLKTQEMAKPTIYLREVMQIRFLLSIIDKLNAYRAMSEDEKSSAGSEVDYLRGIYKVEEEHKKTPGGRLYHIGQEDLATLFMGSSFNVTYGTVLVLIGTLAALLRELFPK